MRGDLAEAVRDLSQSFPGQLQPLGKDLRLSLDRLCASFRSRRRVGEDPRSLCLRLSPRARSVLVSRLPKLRRRSLSLFECPLRAVSELARFALCFLELLGRLARRSLQRRLGLGLCRCFDLSCGLTSNREDRFDALAQLLYLIWMLHRSSLTDLGSRSARLALPLVFGECRIGSLAPGW